MKAGESEYLSGSLNIMEYMPSKYNCYLNIDDESYVYNLISGSIIKLSNELLCFLSNNKDTSFGANTFNNTLLHLLDSHSIIIPVDFNEIEYLQFLYNKDKFDDSYLSVVMLPTLQCNLGCHYCYEKNKVEKITPNSLNALSLFFKKQSKIKRYIAVRWSGGEMMLQWSNIKKLSNEIIQYCRENNCKYVASCVTNATLLTEEIVHQFKSIGISSVQITLDGNETYHNKVRHYRNGTGTFNDILKNIVIASKHLNVIIRLNIDKFNISCLEDLFDTISKTDINKDNIQLFCKPVICTQARQPRNDTFSHKEFYLVELKLLKLAEKYNLPYAFHWGIRGKNTRCAYNNLQGFYITPSLNLYKCPIFIDNDINDTSHSVGHISESGDMIISNHEELNKCLKYSPFDHEECLKCKVLPICHGKCVKIWEINQNKENEGCIPDKYSIENKITYAIKNEVEYNALLSSGIV